MSSNEEHARETVSHGSQRASLDAIEQNKQTINIGTSTIRGLICSRCGSDDICPEAQPIWKITLIFFFKITLILFFICVLVVIFWQVYTIGCDDCYDKGYTQGIKDERARWHQREAPPQNLPGEAQEFGECDPANADPQACDATLSVRDAIRWSRYYLHRGDAESALVDNSSTSTANTSKNIRRQRWARRFYRHAMEIGSGVGSQAAIYAAKRIQYQSMTCHYDDSSLARISRNLQNHPQGLGGLIEMKQKQQALKALGYYNGHVDNRHGAQSRAAVRDFQADLGHTQNGVLSAEQTVLLICGGAQIAKNIDSQNVLGIMYATGLGVRQNTDFALNWLEEAAQRGDADAAWNLALLYGTQTVIRSVFVCDATQNPDRADGYLREAARGGHPAAINAINRHPNLTPVERWNKLNAVLNKPNALQLIRVGCAPNGGPNDAPFEAEPRN